MADFAQIRELTARKKLLVATADVQRLLLIDECTRVSGKLAGVESGYRVAHKAMPLIKLTAPLAALLLLRRKPRQAGTTLLQKASSGLRMAAVGLGLWKNWKNRRRPSVGPTSGF